MRKVLLVGLAAVSLGGCGQGLFGGVQSPHRKPGLWEQTTVSDRLPAPLVTKWCFDAASDRQLPVLGRRRRARGAGPAPTCKVSLTKNGDSYVSDSQCSMGGATMINHSVISGDFDTKYVTTNTITVQGASDPARNGQHTITTTAVYKGECPPELQPGQVERPDGEVVEMASMRNGFGSGGRGGSAAGNAAANTASNTASAAGH